MSQTMFAPPIPTRTRAADLDAPLVPLERCLSLAGRGFSSGDLSLANGAMQEITRTGVTYNGPGYGFALKPEMSASVWDRSRAEIGPFNLINWRPIKYKQFWLPALYEKSKLSGSRWGGMTSTVGLSEIVDMSNYASNPQLSRINYNMCDFRVFTQASRDILADTALIEPMIDYVAKSEIRVQVDEILIGQNSANANSSLYSVTPAGIMGSPCTVVVGRAGASAIASTDLDKLWSALTPSCQRRAYWHCSSETVQYLDEASAANLIPETVYVAAGKYGNDYGLIKGRPLIPTDACPSKGTDGDIVVCDWSQYWMFYHVDQTYRSDLSFNVLQPSDLGHLGVAGMQPDLVEARKSEHFLFTSDIVTFLFVARMDGNFVWSSTVKNENGTIVGPCACLGR